MLEYENLVSRISATLLVPGSVARERCCSEVYEPLLDAPEVSARRASAVSDRVLLTVEIETRHPEDVPRAAASDRCFPGVAQDVDDVPTAVARPSSSL